MQKKARQMVKHAKKRARQKGYEFSLKEAWLRAKLEKGVCELTKLPFDFSEYDGGKTTSHRASLDRIDSSKGYTEDNCRVVLFCVNSALNSYGLETMKPIFKILAEL